MNNYIVDRNPFLLAGPPKWWLKRLWEFDDSLVVLVSCQSHCYRLCQRRPPDPRALVVSDVMKEDGDAATMARYGLIPVTTIIATANWSNPYIFEELRTRAPWRMGGADRVIEDIETREMQQEMDKRQATDEHLTSLSKDGWGLYRKKIGLQSHMWIPKTNGV